jgi:hypothetical protein
MPRLQAILLSLALLCVAGVAEARKEALVDPPPIPIPTELTQDQVVKSIKAGLYGRGWAVALEEPGHMESTLNLRDHVARIDIKYDSRQITIAYLDSSNLDYKNVRGTRYIHPNYLNWINYLKNDIASNMQMVMMLH